MKLSQYEKAMGYWCVFCLFSLLTVGSIGLFITHAEQPTIYAVFIIISTMIIGAIIIGYLQLRATRKQGQKKYWYQQIEITGGLAFLCFIPILPTISLFDILFHAHPLRIVYYAEMSTLFFWVLLSLLFLAKCDRPIFNHKLLYFRSGKSFVLVMILLL